MLEVAAPRQVTPLMKQEDPTQRQAMRSISIPSPEVAPQHPLLDDLTTEEDRSMRKIWQDAGRAKGTELLTFQCWGMQLSARDIVSLQPGKWVNRNIVNFFARFLLASFDSVAIPPVEATISICTKRKIDGNEGTLELNNRYVSQTA